MEACRAVGENTLVTLKQKQGKLKKQQSPQLSCGTANRHTYTKKKPVTPNRGSIRC
jgi:hypothetical protein